MFSCCGCPDDEAWKYGECFCSCHTYAHMDKQLNQDGRQTPAPSGHVGLGTAGQASSPVQSSVSETANAD